MALWNMFGRPKANFLLEIDGTMTGAYIKKASGGRRTREKVKHNMGPTQEVPMGLGGKLKYEPITFDVSIAMGKRLLEWVNSAFQNNPEARNGAIYEANHNMDLVREIRFTNALITEVTIPTMDANSKEHAYLTIKIQPTTVDFEELGSPKSPPAGWSNEGQARARNFSTAHFDFNIDGMGGDSKYVTKLDSFTWKANVKEDPICGEDVPGWAHCGMDPFELKTTFSPGLVRYFDEWEDQFLRMGEAGEVQHRTAELTFQDIKHKPLSTLKFTRMGIAGSTNADYEAGSTDLSRYDVQLYASTLQLELNASEFDDIS